eukprot:4924786-Amphidinium_carterae.4
MQLCEDALLVVKAHHHPNKQTPKETDLTCLLLIGAYSLGTGSLALGCKRLGDLACLKLVTEVRSTTKQATALPTSHFELQHGLRRSQCCPTK